MNLSLWSQFDSSKPGRGDRYNIERYNNYRTGDGPLLLLFMALLNNLKVRRNNSTLFGNILANVNCGLINLWLGFGHHFRLLVITFPS